MRLYLSSYRLGNRPEKLVGLLGANKRVAVILNAGDYRAKEERNKRFTRETESLAALGMTASELDLRTYFGDPKGLRAVLSQYEALWILGGNAFLLRRAMFDSGFDKIIKELLRDDKIVYAGYSAAVVVLAPSMRGFEIADDVNAVKTVYGKEPMWNGLNVLPYAIAPHYRSDHKESADVERVVEFFTENGIPFKTLRDGQALVVNGDATEVVG